MSGFRYFLRGLPVVSTANVFSTVMREQRAVSVLSAKFQDSVNAQIFIWKQFLSGEN